jgi:monoamine oxidase
VGLHDVRDVARRERRHARGPLLIDVGIQSVFSVEARDLSLLFVLFYIAAAGNETTPGDFNRLLNVAGGAQEQRFVGGAQQPTLRMAAALAGG